MKILIAVNSSDQSQEALRFASQFVHRSGETPMVLSVIEPGSKQKYLEGEEKLQKTLKTLAGVEMNSRVEMGQFNKIVLQEMEQGGYELLIVGEVKDSHFSRLFKGSMMIHLVESATCPIIVVKGQTSTIHRILLCDSGAGRSSVLSRFTVQLAQMLEGEEEVTVLHVMSQMSAGPGVVGKQLRASVGELMEAHTPEGLLLQRDIYDLEDAGLHPTPLVRHGLVVDEILSEIKSGDYDLVVIGAHQGPKWQQLLLENLAEKIILQAEKPVLVLR